MEINSRLGRIRVAGASVKPGFELRGWRESIGPICM